MYRGCCGWPADRKRVAEVGTEMTNKICRDTGTLLLGKAIVALLLFGTWNAPSQAQTVSDRPVLVEQSGAATGYVYWTNTVDGSIGRATTAGSKVNEKFIRLKNTTG